MAILVMIWVVETMARAEAWQTQDELEAKQKEHQQVNYNTSETTNATDTSFLEKTQEEESKATIVNEAPTNRFYVTKRKFELNEMCYMFLGRIGKISYEVCTILYLFGGLWSYGSVFAQSAASHIPLPVSLVNGTLSWFTCDVYRDGSSSCTILYLIYIAVFGLIVVPLTCLNLTEQKPLQVCNLQN